MIHIKDQVHMGMGDHSYAYMGYLHQRLAHAFTILGGIQQPPHATDSEESCRQYEQDVEDGEIELEQIAREIYVGLTGVKPPPRISSETRMELEGKREVQKAVEKGRTTLINWIIGAILVLQVIFFIYLFFFV